MRNDPMNFCLNPLSFDVCETNTYGWVTHMHRCQCFGEKYQNTTRLHTPKLHTLENIFQQYQLKTTTFSFPNVFVKQKHMFGNTNEYVWVLKF